MSWAEIKKAVNSNLDVPLDQQIGLIPFDEYFYVNQNITLAEGIAEQTLCEYTGKCVVLFASGSFYKQNATSIVHFYKDGTEIQKFRLLTADTYYSNFGYAEKNSIIGITMNSGNDQQMISLYNNNSAGSSAFPYYTSKDIMVRPLDAPDDTANALHNMLVVGHNLKCDSSFKITIERVSAAADTIPNVKFGMVLGVYN